MGNAGNQIQRSSQCDPLRLGQMPKSFPLLIEDTTDADNQIALAGFCNGALANLSEVTVPKGIFGVSRRHVDLSFPLAFAKGIAKKPTRFPRI